MVWFDNFHHQLNHRGGRKELTTFLAFYQGKLAQEELVDLAENIAIGISRDVGEVFQ